MGEECLFCKIFAGEIPANVVYKDDTVMAFRDVRPQAPNHILVIPKKHIGMVSGVDEEDVHLLGRMIIAAKKVAEKLGMKSYRLVMNCGGDAGQEVFHIHLHLLGGRKFSWPPG
ncbi:MAG: histidine triad nucleotide-binding protein [Elusimicrobia bacterium]|nr:histidine triad nucleotide-binding protein [Elusimicrobiota bacterium]